MKQTNEQKALAACRDYVHWQAEIKRLSGAIGGHLYKCHKNRPSDEAVSETHLAEAYRPDIDEYRTTYLRPDEVFEFLREVCPHCLAAHGLIQERKKAKQKFGAAKRWVARIGKENA